MDEDFVMDICGELSSQSHLLGLRPQAEMEVFSYGQQVAEGRAVKSLGEGAVWQITGGATTRRSEALWDTKRDGQEDGRQELAHRSLRGPVGSTRRKRDD